LGNVVKLDVVGVAALQLGFARAALAGRAMTFLERVAGAAGAQICFASGVATTGQGAIACFEMIFLAHAVLQVMGLIVCSRRFMQQ
jgi:hypothetical protein